MTHHRDWQAEQAGETGDAAAREALQNARPQGQAAHQVVLQSCYWWWWRRAGDVNTSDAFALKSTSVLLWCAFPPSSSPPQVPAAARHGGPPGGGGGRGGQDPDFRVPWGRRGARATAMVGGRDAIMAWEAPLMLAMSPVVHSVTLSACVSVCASASWTYASPSRPPSTGTSRYRGDGFGAPSGQGRSIPGISTSTRGGARRRRGCLTT